jgi:ketosteroid isomerase-like protein
MTDTAARVEVLRDAMRAAATADQALDPIDAVGDKLIAEWRVAVTHSGPLVLDELEVEPTGRRFELRGVFIAEFEGDRIRAFRQYWDEAELLEGLGLLPDD